MGNFLKASHTTSTACRQAPRAAAWLFLIPKDPKAADARRVRNSPNSCRPAFSTLLPLLLGLLLFGGVR
eukprot:224694-Prorocentrum_minimum.AAC.1